MSFIYINGNFYEEHDAKISVKDRAFRFGDGVFETVSIDNGKISHWNLHKTRLEGGLKALKIEFNTERLESDIIKTAEKNEVKNGSARIAITRGEGSRGYIPTYQKPCNVVIEAMNTPQMNRVSGNLCISSYRKIPRECLPVNYKISQGLNSTLAKIEAKEKGFFDAIQLNIKGEIAECASSNIFWIKGNKIYTPSLECDILSGVTRQVVIKKIKTEMKDFKIIEGKFKPKALKKADEIFITNSLLKIFFIDEVEGIFKNKKGTKVTEKIKFLI